MAEGDTLLKTIATFMDSVSWVDAVEIHGCPSFQSCSQGSVPRKDGFLDFEKVVTCLNGDNTDVICKKNSDATSF